MTNDSAESTRRSNHYVHCDHCGLHQADWSVIVGDDDQIKQIECKACGGTGWERGRRLIMSDRETRQVQRLRCVECRMPFFVADAPDDCPNCGTEDGLNRGEP